MLIKTIFAGFGGQGVLSIGRNLAEAGMREGKYVTYLPSYGVEVRGGTANCTVAISDEQIASPVASSPEYVVVMNQPSLVKFQNQLESGGLIFVNSSVATTEVSRGDIDVVSVPATAIAEKMGSPKAANMVMLGAFIKKTKLVGISTISATLGDSSARKAKSGDIKKSGDINKKALMAGYELF
jgi:2-oxoglutarate ferredoxin oxidoreductase subunit gamma